MNGESEDTGGVPGQRRIWTRYFRQNEGLVSGDIKAISVKIVT